MTETKFGIQFIVTRNGEPITDVIAVENMPINLHEKHDRVKSWVQQVKVLEVLVGANLLAVDALADVVPDTHLVGLPTPPKVDPIREKLGTPILKVVNRVLLVLLKRLTAHNAKRGDHVD